MIVPLAWWTSDFFFDYQQQIAGKAIELFPPHEKVHEDYTGPSFQYVLNKQGFRSELPGKPGVLFIGCSISFGQGVPQESCWVSLVCNKLGLPYYNLSWPGSSAMTIYRILQRVLPQYPCYEKVFVYFPHYARREIYVKGELTVGLPSGGSFEEECLNVFDVVSQGTAENDFLYCVASIHTLCKKLGRRLLMGSWDETSRDMLLALYPEESIPLTLHHNIDKGRDGIHPGVKAHKLFAEEVMSSVEKVI